MAKRRRFTPQFKAEVVIEALTGQSSQAELCRTHSISQEQLSKWKHQLIDMQRLYLNPTTSTPMTLNSRLLNWSNLLAD